MTTGAASGLRDEHEAALGRTEVRHIEAGIGTDDADRRDVRDVVALGHHLRSEQNIVFLPAEFRQDLLMRELRIRRIAVHADDTGRRDQLMQFLLKLLGPRAEIFDVAAAAFRADIRHRLRHVAVMAGQLAVLMVDQRQAAEAALDDLAAGTAHDKGREAAPVQHDDDLLMLCHRGLDELPERAGHDMTVAHAQFLTHIHALHDRQRHIADTRRHREQGELALLRTVIRFQRRCRTAEQQDGLMDPRQFLGHDTGMVARGLVLLVGHVLLLIHDDEADIASGGEKRRPGTNDDAGLPTPHPDDRIVALRERQPAVHDHDIRREVGLEGHDNLTGQRDLRHKNDDLPAGFPHASGHLDIDLCLAAAGDALEQETMILAACPHRLHRRQGRLLIIGQFHLLLLNSNCPIAVAQDTPLPDLHKAGLGQMIDRSCRDLLVLEDCHRQRLLLCRRQEFKQLQLRFLPLVGGLKIRRHGSGQHDKLLVAGIVPFLRGIFLREDMILHELGEDVRQAVLIVRQRPADLSLLARSLGQQIAIDRPIHRHAQQDMLMLAFVGSILHRDLEPALTRHEKTHHLSQRAQIKRCQPMGRLDHCRGEPGFLIHNILDVFQLDLAQLFCRLLSCCQNKALDLAPAEGHKNAPAHSHVREFSWHAIGIGFRYAFYGNIYKHTCCEHLLYRHFPLFMSPRGYFHAPAHRRQYGEPGTAAGPWARPAWSDVHSCRQPAISSHLP